MKAFRKIRAASDDVDALQSNVAAALAPLTDNELIDGVHLTDVDLETGSNTVPHKLQRKPQGWVITDRDGVATVYRKGWDSSNLTLEASADVKVSIWVF